MSILKFKHGKKYFSPSQLKKLTISIGQLNSYLKREFKPSKAMDLGTAVHTKLLEPSLFEDKYFILDDSDKINEIGGAKPRSTKVYKEWILEVEEKAKGKIILSKIEMAIINIIDRKCTATGISDTYFSGGEAEVTISGIVKDYQEDFKALCIVDYDTDFVSVDLKTTSKPLHKFKFDANDLGYDIQAKLTNSVNGKDFVFVVVQTVSPYDIGVYTCSDYFMNRGKDKINNALSNYENYENKDSTQVLTFEL
jgi:hypothetical protein